MMTTDHRHERRLERLHDDMVDAGVHLPRSVDQGLLLDEIDYALRPRVHERRVPTYGSVIAPTTDPDTWAEGAQLGVTLRVGGTYPVDNSRMFADGRSSWLVRGNSGEVGLLVFDRPAGSERDLTVLARVTGGVMVQRHPSGRIVVANSLGVARWDGIGWHHEPPVGRWIESIVARGVEGDPKIIERLLELAVHDLGARGLGATLVYRPDGDLDSNVELRLDTPPPLSIEQPADLAPLAHVLGQVDGAAIFDAAGRLRQLGSRLVSSEAADQDVAGLGGMRHTAGRRYSFDFPSATVIVVSEDGPVTVLRDGEMIGTSARMPS